MSQQYVLLRKENDLLNSLIGQSFNQKSKFEAGKILDEIHSKAQDRSIDKKVLCFVHDKGEIKSLGGSTLLKEKISNVIVSNLILDNFGIFLSMLFKGSSVAVDGVGIKDDVGVVEGVNVYGGGANSFQNGVLNFGTLFRIGSGTTPPARTDFKTETRFVTLPESIGFSPITAPIWNSALGNFKTISSITAGGSGTINESVLFMLWDNNLGAPKTFATFRDIISPGSSFIAGQSIALEYTVQL